MVRKRSKTAELPPPRTLAEHIKRMRLFRNLYQRDVAKQMGVDKATVANWEKGKTAPPITFIPAVIAFLGYDPFDVPQALPEQMLAYRRRLGLSAKSASEQLGVDPGSWLAWEHGTTAPWPRFLRQIEGLLAK